MHWNSSEWLPISSAPKDGTRILAIKTFENRLDTRWHKGLMLILWMKNSWRYAHDYNIVVKNSRFITHWFPIPVTAPINGELR